MFLRKEHQVLSLSARRRNFTLGRATHICRVFRFADFYISEIAQFLAWNIRALQTEKYESHLCYLRFEQLFFLPSPPPPAPSPSWCTREPNCGEIIYSFVRNSIRPGNNNRQRPPSLLHARRPSFEILPVTPLTIDCPDEFSSHTT